MRSNVIGGSIDYPT